MKKKQLEKEYLECPRCKLNNFDEPEFWGCPRGSCETEAKGTLITTIEVVK
jgi:hypothetical protein